jgi:hypothetical protein
MRTSVTRRLTRCDGNIMPPGRRGRSSELIIKVPDYMKIGLLDVRRRGKVRYVTKFLPCVVDDTKRVNMGLDDREISEGCLVEVVDSWRRL